MLPSPLRRLSREQPNGVQNYSAVELARVPLPTELDDAQLALEDDPTEQGLSNAFGRGSDDEGEELGALSPLFEKNLRFMSPENIRSALLTPIEDWRGGRVSLADRLRASCRHCCTREALRQKAIQKIPMMTWLPKYSLSLLRADLLAGVTVGVVLIPQGVAYAMLAELPPIYGLYSSLLPLPIYCAMCTSRHMSIGPFALVSLLVADSVSEVVSPDDEAAYIGAVMLLSLMIGLLHCAMAALNLGIIVRFISDSVLAGFTSAAAILISASQLKHLLGMPIPRAPFFHTLLYIATHLSSINPLALIVGLAGIGLLELFKRLNKKLCKNIPLPEQLLLLLLATLVTWYVAMPCLLSSYTALWKATDRLCALSACVPQQAF